MPDTRRAEDFRSAANGCWYFTNSDSVHSKAGGSTWLQSAPRTQSLLWDRSLRAALHSRSTEQSLRTARLACATYLQTLMTPLGCEADARAPATSRQAAAAAIQDVAVNCRFRGRCHKYPALNTLPDILAGQAGSRQTRIGPVLTFAP
jgi:hypothetical protein